MAPEVNDFRSELERILLEARGGSVEVNSGELHRRVGGYPDNSHRMPVCCSVMRAAMKSDDKIISSPPEGNGASLTIRYILPR